MDSHAVNTAEKAQAFLRSHCDALRRDPFLKSAWIIVIYEKNTGFESGHNWKVVADYQPSYALFGKVMSVDKAQDTVDQDPGVDTTYMLKNEYQRVISDSLRSQTSYFYCDWICANPWQKPFAQRRASTKQALVAQLANCRRYLPAMMSDNRQIGATAPRITWSGKIGADGKIVHGQNDDLVMAYGQCLYWINRIHQMNFPGFPYDKIFPCEYTNRRIQTTH